MKGLIIITSGLGFLIGIVLRDINASRVIISMSFLIFVSCVLFIKFPKRRILSFVFLLCSTFGYFWLARYDRMHASRLPEEIFNKKVTLVGDVIDDPDSGIEKTRVIVKPLSIGTSVAGSSVVWKKGAKGDVPDRILIRLGPGANISYGDRVRVSGVIEHPENFITETDRVFDYEHYLALHDVYGIVRAYSFETVSQHHGSIVLEKLFSIKKFFVKKMTGMMPSPESGLLAGIMIGEKSLLPANVLGDFQAAGLTHMIVLSGYNVTIVAMTIVSLFAWIGLGYRGRRIGGLVVIPLFIIMTGLDASAMRAGIMAMIALVLQITTRPASSFRIVVLTLVIMVWVNPRTLLHDPSLHLSYLAFLGLIYMTPIVAVHTERFQEYFGLRDLVTETFAVQLFVMPYILWMNGQVSLLLLLANVITVPLSPIAMGVGFFAALGAIAFFPLGYMLAVPVKIILSYIIGTAHIIASLNMFQFTIPPFGVWWMAGVYAVLVAYLVRYQ